MTGDVGLRGQLRQFGQPLLLGRSLWPCETVCSHFSKHSAGLVHGELPACLPCPAEDSEKFGHSAEADCSLCVRTLAALFSLLSVFFFAPSSSSLIRRCRRQRRPTIGSTSPGLSAVEFQSLSASSCSLLRQRASPLAVVLLVRWCVCACVSSCACVYAFVRASVCAFAG